MIISALILMILTFLTLIVGVVLMVFGGEDLNRKYSSKIMSLRVFLQFCCLILLIVSFI